MGWSLIGCLPPCIWAHAARTGVDFINHRTLVLKRQAVAPKVCRRRLVWKVERRSPMYGVSSRLAPACGALRATRMSQRWQRVDRFPSAGSDHTQDPGTSANSTEATPRWGGRRAAELGLLENYSTPLAKIP